MATEFLASQDANRTLAARALAGLHLVVLAIGVLQFAFVPSSIAAPLIAAISLAALALAFLLTRTVPGLRRPVTRQYSIDLVAMTLAITMLAFTSGGSRSALTALYIAPLAACAVAFGRWWAVLLMAAIVAAALFLLGLLTTGIDVRTREFGVWLLSTLAPASAVSLLLAALAERMQSAAQKISDLSATDTLTGLLNLRAFESVLQQEHRKAERFGRAYSLIMVDVDNLSQINESLGHEAGSLLLNAVASAVSRSVRNSDVAARLGGDEFIVLCAEATPEVAAAIAQRIRNNVYASTVSVSNRLIRANVNVGVANFPADHLYPKELMILADRRMQQDRDLRREPASTK